MVAVQRVALYLPSLRGGGAERVMLDLANGFAARGLATDLVLPQAEGPYLELVDRSVRVVDLSASRVLGSLAGLVRYLARERPDALLTTLTHANLVALWARGVAGVPTRVVVREANTLSQVARGFRRLKNRVLPFLVRRFYPLAYRVVAVSEGVAADLVGPIGLPRELVTVLANPIVTPELARQAAEPLAHPWFEAGAPPVILGAGRLAPQKDFATLVRAFAELRRRRPARLMILGEGAERARLEALVAELRLGEHVALPGFSDNPFPYMSRAAVFVLSSAWEGMPGALIQALACGARVVATDCKSGPREVLQDGRLGRLVEVGDVAGMASAIDQALDSPPAPLPAGALDRFGRAAAVDGYLSILRGEPHA